MGAKDEDTLEGVFFSTVCFLCHQSAEKALKALLYHEGARRRALLTHSLVEMISAAKELKIEAVEDLGRPARELDLHYIPARYPNGLPGGYPHQFYDRSEADKAIRAAHAILAAVEGYFRSKNAVEILADANGENGPANRKDGHP
jgi:HEPN domain-containing protein